MMIETLISVLEKAAASGSPALSAWRITESGQSGKQRFYVGTNLDQSRLVETTNCRVTVYVDSEADEKRYRGEATVNIHASHRAEEISALIGRAAFAASKSRSPWFALPEDAPARFDFPESGFAAGNIDDHMDALAAAFYRHDPRDPLAAPASGSPVGRINSLELFLSRRTTRVLNSRGLRAEYTRWVGECEFITEAEGPAGAVELYDMVSFSEPDLDRLADEAGRYLRLVADRARAVAMPSLAGIPVILRGEHAESVLGWFYDSARADMIYAKASPFAVGSAIQGDEAVAEPLDISGEAFIRGLPQSAPFDADGFPLDSTAIIQKGVITAMHGPARYAAWLDAPANGALPLFSVTGGGRSLEEFHARPYLEPVIFSDFQLDHLSGSFGAEVRFAWYFDGSSRIPVTGGSITGSIMDNRATMLRSSERAIASRALCPEAVMLFSASVTGAE